MAEERKVKEEEEARLAEEDRKRLEEEEALRQAELQKEREEAEAKALEEAERVRQERDRIMQQNQQERMERKKVGWRKNGSRLLCFFNLSLLLVWKITEFERVENDCVSRLFFHLFVLVFIYSVCSS